MLSICCSAGIIAIDSPDEQLASTVDFCRDGAATLAASTFRAALFPTSPGISR